jgi:hypothetical protein
MEQKNHSHWIRSATTLAILTFTLGFMSACSHNDTANASSVDTITIPESGNSDQSSNGGNPHDPGPEASLTEINVVVKQVFVQTSDGSIIPIPNSSQELDLAAMATTDGVSLQLPGEFGDGQVTVTAVILRLKDEGHNTVKFDDGGSCKLKTGKDLVLVSPDPLVLDRGVPYIIHAAFGALDQPRNEGGHLKCSLSGTEYVITSVEFDSSETL